jgi:hypothetical protein
MVAVGLMEPFRSSGMDRVEANDRCVVPEAMITEEGTWDR